MKNNIYDLFNNIDINFDDYDREDFNDVEKIKIKRNFKKSLNNENKKYMKAVGLIGMSILCTFLIGTESGKNAIAKIRTDIEGMLNVEENIDNYKKEIGETAVDKNIEIKINDVMLDDENNLIISREIKSDKKIKEIPYGSSEDIYINDNKVEFRWNCISDEIIDDYSSATVDKYTLWSEDGDIDFGGDINIKIVYKEVGEYPDYTQGTWEFELNYDNIHNLVEVTKKGKLIINLK